MKAFALTVVIATLLTTQSIQARTEARTTQNHSVREARSTIEKSCRIEATIAAIGAILKDKFNRTGKTSDLAISESGISNYKVSGKKVSVTVSLTLIYNYNKKSPGGEELEFGSHAQVDVVLKTRKNVCTIVSAKIASEE